MWDEKTIIFAIALSLLPAGCGREQETTSSTTEERTTEHSTYQQLQQRFQKAHTVQGVEGLIARADAYESLGTYYLDECEEQKKRTGTISEDTKQNALNCYSQSRIIAGERSMTLTGISRLSLLEGNTLEATLTAQKALALDENNTLARIIKIRAHHEKRSDWRAVTDMEWYLSHKPGNEPSDENNEQFREYLITAYEERGRREEAQHHATLLSEQHPDNILARRVLGSMRRKNMLNTPEREQPTEK